MDNFFTQNKSNNNFSRSYSKGKSFQFSGTWNEKTTYNNDSFIQDFVVWQEKLWVCIVPVSINSEPSETNKDWELVLEGVSDIEFQQNGNRIQWKYEDESENAWRDLIELDVVSESDIKKMLSDLQVQWGNIYDTELSETSVNAVQNKVITKAIKDLETDIENASKSNKGYVDKKLSELNDVLEEEFKSKQDVIDDLDEIRNKISDNPFEKGSADNSAVLKGGSIATGKFATALGGDNIRGLAEPESGDELLYCTAEGYASHAEGAAHAIGKYSHAEGGGNQIIEGYPTVPTAEGKYSHAEGTHTHAKGDNSHAEGSNTKTIGSSSHAEGNDTVAEGSKSHAEGNGTLAYGRQGHAEGYLTTAYGLNSHAENSRAIAYGDKSHAEGSSDKAFFDLTDSEKADLETAWRANKNFSIAFGENSHVEGTNNFAGSKSTHVEGEDNIAKGNRSHVEGRQNEAVGGNSHAEGSYNQANGAASHVEGTQNTTSNTAEHAEGQYNKSNANTIHSIGIGTSNTDRKNAHEVTTDGKHYIYGIGGYDGTNPDDSDDLAKVINTITGTGEGSIKKTVSDEIAKVVDSAPAAFDTLKEIAEYIEEDQDAAAIIANKLTEHSNAIENLEGNVNNLSKTVAANQTEITKQETQLAELSGEVDALQKIHETLDVTVEKLVTEKVDSMDYAPNLSVGFADNLASEDVVVDSEFNLRQSGGGAIADGVARVKELRGNSVVWNQLVRNEVFAFQYCEGTYDDGIYTVTPNGSGVFPGIFIPNAYEIPIGHKGLCLVKASSDVSMTLGLNYRGDSSTVYYNANGRFDTLPMFFNANDNIATGGANLMIFVRNATESFKLYAPQVYDLTQMFGVGNEPTTIEEFYSRIPQNIDLNTYNEGEVISMNVDAVKSVGRNVWDEEWERGSLDVNTGEELDSATIRSANYIPVIGGQSYYTTYGLVVYFFYDANKNFIKSVTTPVRPFTIPTNATFMRFCCATDYGTTYNNDICINLSDTDFNGQYEPYKEDICELPAKIKEVFPDGMKSAGTAHDIVYNDLNKEVGVLEKRIEKRIFTSCTSIQSTNDAGIVNITLTASEPYGQNVVVVGFAKQNTLIANTTTEGFYPVFINGNKLTLYLRLKSTTIGGETKPLVNSYLASHPVTALLELATPEVTEHTEPFNFDYQVTNGGQEEAITNKPSTPIRAEIAYGFSAVDTIKDNKANIVTLQNRITELETLITQLQTAISSMEGVINEITETE